MDLKILVKEAARALNRTPVSAWEVMAGETKSLNIGLSGGEVDKYQESSSLGLAVRVLRDSKLGFSYALGGGAEGVLKAVDEAVASAESSDLICETGFAQPPRGLTEVDVFDGSLAQETQEDKLARAREMDRAAREADPRVVHVHPAEVEEGSSHFCLLNSEGLDLCHRYTSVGGGLVAMAAEGQEQEAGWDMEGGRYWSQVDLAGVGRRAGEKAAAGLGAKPVGDGRYPLVLDHTVAVEFLGLLAESFLGDNLQKGRSLLAGKESRAVAGPAVSIVDHGLLPRGLGTSPYDAEGTPQRENTLVEAGVLQGFVFDRLWAGRAGTASTGNASRAGIKSPVEVGFNNLFIKPGQENLQGLVRRMGEGLLITQVMGAHIADPVSGEFSLGAEGHRVEGGEISSPVKSIALAGTLQELFMAVEMVGSDLRFFGRTGSPSLLVDGLSVSGP